MSTRFAPPTNYRVAAIQYAPSLGEKERNIADLLALVEEAAQHGARIIVLPEMGTTGHCWASRAEIAPYVETIPGPTTQHFQVLATRYQCYIALGLPEVDPETQAYYNSLALLGPEGLVGTYRKLHSSLYEPRWARDGDQGIQVWETPLGRLGGLIGEDNAYFEAARLAALQGADIVLCPTNWTLEHSPINWWMARALENGIYVLAANREGVERGIRFHGGSCLVNPDGSIQTALEGGTGVLYGEVDVTRSREKRWGSSHNYQGDRLADRRPRAYVSLTNNQYLWEPLRYHSLYELGELPPGQLSCVGFLQLSLQSFGSSQSTTPLQIIQNLVRMSIRDNAPASPDVLVLPELALPGPVLLQSTSQNPDQSFAEHMRAHAISIPGPETDELVALANELQLSMVIGVAEHDQGQYYNTVLLLDPQGIYGTYRKLHLTRRDRLWASPGNLGLSTFDTPSGRIGLATGYDVLFPETLRVLAGLGTDLVCAPAFLDFPNPVSMTVPPTAKGPYSFLLDEEERLHHLIWSVRAAEHDVYLALTNWSQTWAGVGANGMSGVFSPTSNVEVVADEDDPGLMMMTIDTREQRTGRRTTHTLDYAPGDMAGSLTGELAYNVLDSIPGNVVRAKPMLRKRQPYWYLDLVRERQH
ncbi:nitrilase-related carbon-nitrogen hydrolase [Ktedonospora formicarum]|uniref:Amidohydrolase n=1 Tax=Ktedonospora formicarum TaxID=2778364 RepID=A0A8J3MQD6_9CHLR|nr:nitrilase-related carbon-nitrogen hydrolase [Ktedonospora formicarum]GHO44787.1 amidohydrolase [Ktedonospora formicarum]